jgi:hypothetical protein
MKNNITLLTLGLCILFSSKAFSQCPVPNGNFETWTEGSPAGWFGLGVKKITGRNGGFAIQLDTANLFEIPFPAFLRSMYPCTQKSAYLNGYLKATIANSDSLFLVTTFGLQADTTNGGIGAGVVRSNYNNWTAFHIPIQNLNPGAVDTVNITFITFGVNSKFQFDDLAFSNTPTGINIGVAFPSQIKLPFHQKNNLQFSLHPNPATAELNLDLTKVQGPVDFAIVDLTGKEVLHKTMIGSLNSKVDIKGLKPGIYTSRLRTKTSAGFKKLIVQ